MNSFNSFIVDSFTDRPFAGNPAGVVLAHQSLSDCIMQSIAAELNFSETAFVFSTGQDNHYSIRYFSPFMEIPLCGHATLAAAKAIFQENHSQEIKFTNQNGLVVTIQREGSWIQMQFPVYGLQPAVVPKAMLDALGIRQVEYCGFNEETNIIMLEIESAKILGELQPDFAALIASHDSIHGVLVTAAADDDFDFHSRFFWPWSGGNEDPVTGATHTFMAPYWSEKTGKTIMKSFQASARTGQMEVEIITPKQLLIRGNAVIVFSGTIRI